MTLRSLIYLSQLEEYDADRIAKWLKAHPNSEVLEIKGHLKWTVKAHCLFCLTHCLSLLLPPKVALIKAIHLLQPLDFLLKFLFVFLAALKLRLFHPGLIVIGITGSYGKTTIKDKIHLLLAPKFSVYKTHGNNNTLIGICQNIFKIPPPTKIFICEIGAYRIGDIAHACRLVRPRIGIITSIGIMHLERFGTVANILKTKIELAKFLPANGLLILPVTQKASIPDQNLAVKNIAYFSAANKIFNHAGKYFGLTQKTIQKRLLSTPPSNHRLQITKNGQITIIDDTYNSNPVGFHMALNKLKTTKSTNRILVTPGMIELGHLQISENKKLAQEAASICNHLVFVGLTNRQALLSGAGSALRKTKIHLLDNFNQVQPLLSSITTGSTAILFENDLPDHYF